MKIIEITPAVKSVIDDLKDGRKMMVTNEKDGFTVSIEGGGKHRADVLLSAYKALKDGDMLKETDPGLFEGCGQCFIIVR